MKLYRCTVEVVYYALAENREEAANHADEAIRDVGLWNHVDADEDEGKWMKSDGWDEACLVYHDGDEDITMKDAIKTQKDAEAG